MLVYRIIPTIYSKSLHAPGLAGRWNGAGRKVIYTAESIPVAFMENMVRRKGLGFNDLFAIMVIDIPDTLAVSEIAPSSLAKDGGTIRITAFVRQQETTGMTRAAPWY